MIPPITDPGATLVLRRTFSASRQRVFQAWIDPQALALWFKPKGMSVIVRSLTAQVGGSFHFDLENGGSIFGTYLHIAPPEKLVFTWSGTAFYSQETIVTLDFFDLGQKTEVVLTHEGLCHPDLRALVASGWPSLLDQLSSLFFSFPLLK